MLCIFLDAVTIVLYNTMSTMSTMDVIEPSQVPYDDVTGKSNVPCGGIHQNSVEIH